MSSRGRSGEYYRNKYGRGGGRGRGGSGGGPQRQGHNNDNFVDGYSSYRTGHPTNGNNIENSRGWNNNNYSSKTHAGGSFQELSTLLREQLDGRPYPAYHDIETSGQAGWWHSQLGFTLLIGRTQSDPYAPPTRGRVVVPQSTIQLPVDLISNKVRRIAVADYLWRQVFICCRRLGADQGLRSTGSHGDGVQVGGSGGGQGWSGPKGGDLQVMEPTQHVLEQSAVQVDVKGNVALQLTINLPAQGRTILGLAANRIFNDILGSVVQSCLVKQSINVADLRQHVESVEDQAWLQSQLDAAGLVAFVRNGAVLPRHSGVDDRPMATDIVIPFQSPLSLECKFVLPNTKLTVAGMGIPKGITLICGGGYHGKTTMMQTLQVGVYWKTPGDGREFCVTVPSAIKIRAEDGRHIQQVDVSPFIRNLPFSKDTKCFSTLDASGSTSQAANISESIEMGASTLLIDEDTCATNFMIRDSKMIKLVAPDKEPITPFLAVVRSLAQERDVSTILVVGSAGDYFNVADKVLLMDTYRCEDATERAKQIASEDSVSPMTASFGMIRPRYVVAKALVPNGKVKVQGRTSILYGETQIELAAMEQLVCSGQTTAISEALQTIAASSSGGRVLLREILESLDQSMDEKGFEEVLAPGVFHGGLVRPRLYELGAAINRIRQHCASQ